MVRLGRAIDLTHSISDTMTIYPGDPSPKITRVKRLSSDGVNLSGLQMGSHTGTHVDAPYHFVGRGRTVDRLPAEQFVGEAIVLDVSFKRAGEGIEGRDLERFRELVGEGIIVLLYTGMSRHWDDDWAREKFTYLSGSAARWLISKEVRAVGIDCLSVEKFGFSDAVAHKTLLENGVTIIESLNSNLSRLVGRKVLFVCLPIKVRGADGAPARAIAFPLM